MPFTIKNTDAAAGLANTVRRKCSNARPMTPIGTVATTITMARRSSGVSIRRFARTEKKARMIRIQVSRKCTSRAKAVATCNATRNAR